MPGAFTAAADDIDELGHVNNAVWVRWIQDIAVAHWEAVAPAAHREAYVWVVTRHEIDYRGNLSIGDSVTGETWVGEPRGARFDRHVRFTGAGRQGEGGSGDDLGAARPRHRAAAASPAGRDRAVPATGIGCWMMMFAKRLREGVRSGGITSSIRIWQSSRVKAGSLYRMEDGQILIESIQRISIHDITGEMARRSGFDGVIDLLKVARHGAGSNVYLIEFQYLAPDR